jgi:spore germination cell wall hydrolase CwlJ-like protein
MRNNKAILDEAARSVRRTFIGSVAGSVVMLAVVGAAGAYGMPEKLTAQALSLAMAKFNIKFPQDPVPPPVERPVTVVQYMPRAAMPVSDAVPSGTIVREVAQAASPVAEVASPLEAPVATTPPAAKPVAAAPAVKPVAAPPAAEAVTAPAPMVTASLALPGREPVDPRSLLSAPMVFEAPKPADAQMLTALPKTEEVAAPAAPPEPVETAKTVEPAKPTAPPVQQASIAAEPDPSEFPKSVMVVLPQPKPPLSPAQRLELQGKEYDKAERCLTQAIYFEARNEPARGQQAVAQVVLNRVFSPHYPKDVCSVVYQNAHRHLSCQFTFACDGKPESVNERGAWARASRVAKQTLAAQVWLPDVNKATHYHAAYVRPNWIRDMKVMVRHGLHTFYRPRNWGDGSDEAKWGTPSNSVKSAPTPAKPLTPAQKRFSYRKA